MIYFNFTLRNPLSDMFKHLYAKSGKLTKYKAWEVEIYRCDSIIELEGRFTFREDHAGFMVDVGLFSYVIRAQIYDTRHWNYEKKQWEIYND